VVGVCQLVQDDGRVLEHLLAGEQLGCVGDVYLLGQAFVVSAVGEPFAIRMVMFAAQLRVGVLDPDSDRAKLLERLRRNQDGDALQVIGEHLQRTLSCFAVWAFE